MEVIDRPSLEARLEDFAPFRVEERDGGLDEVVR